LALRERWFDGIDDPIIQLKLVSVDPHDTLVIHCIISAFGEYLRVWREFLRFFRVSCTRPYSSSTRRRVDRFSAVIHLVVHFEERTIFILVVPLEAVDATSLASNRAGVQ